MDSSLPAVNRRCIAAAPLRELADSRTISAAVNLVGPISTASAVCLISPLGIKTQKISTPSAR